MTSRTPPTDVMRELWARDIRAMLDAKHGRETAHLVYMAAAMWLTEQALGVPYGPALCEVRPNPKLRGLLITGDPRNRAERRHRAR